ncbi:MAG: HNH endonuclease [Flavobacteriales bacterium]|nr:HNH endonuclease [Flavobacteriales bacterium]
MAVYNTDADAANTAVRAFLTKLGGVYMMKSYGLSSYNTRSGRGKEIWGEIVKEFKSCCAYCGCKESDKVKLEMEHLIMVNRDECGLHLPGNTVPVCKPCNKRKKEASGVVNWRKQLGFICDDPDVRDHRIKRIEAHMAKYEYPLITVEEQEMIQAVATRLSERVREEGSEAWKQYEARAKAFQ